MTLFGRRFSGLALALLVSLCLNAFALAAFGSHWFGDKPRRPEGRPFDRLIMGVPEVMRPALRGGLDARRGELDSHIAAMRAARGRIGQTLRAPELDGAALDAAFGDLRQRQLAVQEVLHHAMMEALTKSPPEARSAWAERWSDRRR